MPRRRRKPVELHISIYIRYLHQHGGMRVVDIAKKFSGIPRRTVAHHAKLPIQDDTEDRRHQNKGRPRKLTDRDDRRIASMVTYLRENETKGFTSKRVS